MTNPLYVEHIMDHYRNPRNFGKIPDAQIKNHESNTLCGDEYEFDLKLENGIVSEIKFFGDGCAISKASASLLSDNLIGKNLEQIKSLTEKDILKFLGIEVNAMRMKCAMFPLVIVLRGIENFEKEKI